MEKKIGDYVKVGETIALLYTNNKKAKESALKQMASAVTISNKKTKTPKEVLAVIK